MSAIVVINEGMCLDRGRGQFSMGLALVIKRFHRESDILVDPQHRHRFCCWYLNRMNIEARNNNKLTFSAQVLEDPPF